MGLEFLFASALFALPLAASPVILHLLFRRKSRVIQFSTLRFIRASMQQTAARKRLQQWLLLAARVLLLLLLIWAIAQPARKLASSWFGGSGATIAAIVVDDSYSMMLQQNHVPRLDTANDAILDLLRNELRGAKVALFKSQTPVDGKPEALVPAGKLLEQWSPLKPSPATHPLADRVASAAALLDRQDASDKWLIILSDLQSREFPHPLAAINADHIVLLDLHPDNPRSVGITSVTLDPPQSLAGVSADAVVDVDGRAGDTRACSVSFLDAEGHEEFKSSPTMANLSTDGRIQLRFPIRLPAERFVQLKASLSGSDDLPWDDSRALLVGVPPRQVVRLISPATSTVADRTIGLALDPNEGHDSVWPLDVRRGTLDSSDRAAVVVAAQWPGESLAHQLFDLAQGGGSVVLFLQPGIEQSWSAISDAQRAELDEVLPGTPILTGNSGGAIVPTSDHEPLLAGLTDDKGAFPQGRVKRLTPFDVAPDAATILGIASEESSSRPHGLLYRKSIGRGIVYTFATWPDAIDSGLATNPAFLPLLVRMCLPVASASSASNVELGQPVVFDTTALNNQSLTLQAPDGGTYSIAPTVTKSGKQFRFDRATQPGLYIWRTSANADPVAATNVQLPAAESELVYRRPGEVIAPAANAIVATSLDDLRSRAAVLAAPQPQWSGPIAIVLLLICFETLMASTKGLWRWPGSGGAVHSGVAGIVPQAR